MPEMAPCPRPDCGGSLVARHVAPYGDGRKLIELACTLCSRPPEQRPWESATRPRGSTPGFHKGVDLEYSHRTGAGNRQAAMKRGSPFPEGTGPGYQPGIQGWQTRRKAGQE